MIPAQKQILKENELDLQEFEAEMLSEYPQSPTSRYWDNNCIVTQLRRKMTIRDLKA